MKLLLFVCLFFFTLQKSVDCQTQTNVLTTDGPQDCRDKVVCVFPCRAVGVIGVNDTTGQMFMGCNAMTYFDLEDESKKHQDAIDKVCTYKAYSSISSSIYQELMVQLNTTANLITAEKKDIEEAKNMISLTIRAWRAFKGPNIYKRNQYHIKTIVMDNLRGKIGSEQRNWRFLRG